MKTYLVSYQDCGSSLNNSLYIAECENSQSAAKAAIDAFGFNTPQSLVLGKTQGEKETFLAYSQEDNTAEEILAGYLRHCLNEEVSLLHVLPIEAAKEKRLKAGQLL
jgi:hypothetical protein